MRIDEKYVFTGGKVLHSSKHTCVLTCCFSFWTGSEIAELEGRIKSFRRGLFGRLCLDLQLLQQNCSKTAEGEDPSQIGEEHLCQLIPAGAVLQPERRVVDALLRRLFWGGDIRRLLYKYLPQQKEQPAHVSADLLWRSYRLFPLPVISNGNRYILPAFATLKKCKLILVNCYNINSHIPPPNTQFSRQKQSGSFSRPHQQRTDCPRSSSAWVSYSSCTRTLQVYTCSLLPRQQFCAQVSSVSNAVCSGLQRFPCHMRSAVRRLPRWLHRQTPVVSVQDDGWDYF